MLENLFVFIVSLLMVVKGATMATEYSTKLAQCFRLSRYVIGFVVVAFISILPEALIAINSAIKGIPSFGLGTLFGSNIADLTLIFAILILNAGRSVKVGTRVLSSVDFYPLILLLPLIFGMNGFYSRIEGLILIFAGSFFYYKIFKGGVGQMPAPHIDIKIVKSVFLLISAMALLLVGSYFTVSSASELADMLNVSPILIGMLVVGLGTTMPELFFSLKSVNKNEDSLAVGDLLGTVLADATIVVGLIAVISPFAFPSKIVYVTGGFMLVSAMVLIKFMRSERKINIKEAFLLLGLWALYVLVELIAAPLG
ncbi:MAG: sodium:calcium antiporter [Minisyncoccota bacterium]